MDLAQDYILGLGGRENIVQAIPAFTRIRVKVVSMAAVSDELLRAAGAYGVVRQKANSSLS